MPHKSGFVANLRLRKCWLALATSCILTGCSPKLLLIPACVETDNIRSGHDAADDVAIWVDREQPERSVVIGTNKRAGLHVYDLAGRELQFVAFGGTNNVDLRSRFSFPTGRAPILGVSRIGRNTVMVLRFDETLRRIVPEPLTEIDTGFQEQVEVGTCLYESKDGTIYVGAAGDTGFRQWRLEIKADGSISANRVREVALKSGAEACAFDDARRRLYVAEQDAGLWRLAAEPEDGDAMVLVDSIKPKGGFTPDIEGLAIYARNDGTGYLVASSQGDSSFRIYRREGDNEFVARFRIVGCPDGRVDEVTHTDGIELTSTSLGENWPAGLLVVQDDKNTDPSEPQNFKYVRWDQIEHRLR